MDEEKKNRAFWFPGHMKRAGFLIKDNLKNVDLVYEVLDARAVKATRNLSILRLCKNKVRIVILNKKDLAEDFYTNLWIRKIKQKEGVFAFSIDGRNFRQTREILNFSNKILQDLWRKRGKKHIKNFRFKAMVVGVPNVGKSTIINSLAGKKKARTANFPGVTLNKQWIAVNENIDLIDMPGKLNFEDLTDENITVLKLIGSIKSDGFDEEEVVFSLLEFLEKEEKKYFQVFFNVKEFNSFQDLLEQYGRKKGMLKKGGDVDFKRISSFLIKEFRQGKMCKVTLQKPNFVSEDF